MVNVRELAEKDLGITLEQTNGGFGLPVELTNDTDGDKQIFKKGSTTELLTGQTLDVTVEIDPQTGEEKVISNPNVTLRISSLDRVPKAGEKWFVKFPIKPDPLAPKFNFLMTKDHAPTVNEALGIITLFLQVTIQS